MFKPECNPTGRAALTCLFDSGLAPYISYSTFFLPSLGVGQIEKHLRLNRPSV
jgi:hypothetical protein